MLQLVTQQERRIVWTGGRRRVEYAAEPSSVVNRGRRFGTCSLGARGCVRVSQHTSPAHRDRRDSCDRDDAEGHCQGQPEAVGIEVALRACQAHTSTDADGDEQPDARAVNRDADRWRFHGGGQRHP